MRYAIAAASLALLVAASSAQAERRIFIIANNPDGYGVDRCLASGSACGRSAADAVCKARSFGQALSYRKVDRDEITGAVPNASRNCLHDGCDEFVAIECRR